jgi:hypothetical protein
VNRSSLVHSMHAIVVAGPLQTMTRGLKYMALASCGVASSFTETPLRD